MPLLPFDADEVRTLTRAGSGPELVKLLADPLHSLRLLSDELDATADELDNKLSDDRQALELLQGNAGDAFAEIEKAIGMVRAFVETPKPLPMSKKDARTILDHLEKARRLLEE